MSYSTDFESEYGKEIAKNRTVNLLTEFVNNLQILFISKKL
ncbi:hypothetical protein UC317_0977 [Lactococcus lactis subsp. lactis]|nr:hypothetical protein LLCRE1631_00034 [Lactococcus lactis subsp. lactis CNCM I-1631]KSU30473.1 hypothetical protein ML8_0534 [Lactococcus lactis subsp. lactis]KSU33065.1 hypothetical protein UC317_0977 [Lactococcus lactis subsp. lactis]